VPPQSWDSERYNLLVESRIGEEADDGQVLVGDDHFRVGDEPTHQIVVKNKNAPECLVTIEVQCGTSSILIGGKKSWRSEEKTIYGRAKPREERERDFDALLKLNKACKDKSLTIRVYWRRQFALTKKEPPKFVGEFQHRLWVE
jgi:hypothetical protein